MIKLQTLMAIAFAATAATPALAVPHGTDAAGDRSARKETPAVAPTGTPARYCIEDSYTGSRIAHRTCLTREEWLQRGVDPTAK